MTALLHHVYNLDTLGRAYFELKKEAAAGVDGETWRRYGENLEANLRDLSERLKRGAYRAKPVRRVYIPQADGRQRPLGATALEDKVIQRAAVEVLNAIHETDFLEFSYGFRPRRSPHQALRRRFAHDARVAAVLNPVDCEQLGDLGHCVKLCLKGEHRLQLGAPLQAADLGPGWLPKMS